MKTNHLTLKTRNKNTKVLKRSPLLKAVFITIAVSAAYLIVVLLSFNPSDPSWLQTAGYEPIHNFGGRIGAWISDMLFFIFGLIAYTIPAIILFLGWLAYSQQRCKREYINYFSLSWHLMGLLIIVFTSCCLIALNVADFDYFFSGGIIGKLLINIITTQVKGMSATLILLFFWIIGVRLFFDRLWRVITKKIIYKVLNFYNFINDRLRYKEHNYSDDKIDFIDDNEAIEKGIVVIMDDQLLSDTKGLEHKVKITSTDILRTCLSGVSAKKNEDDSSVI